MRNGPDTEGRCQRPLRQSQTIGNIVEAFGRHPRSSHSRMPAFELQITVARAHLASMGSDRR